MQLPEICVRRPVFATVLSTIVVLVGIVSYDRLTVREYPNIDPPVVTVETTYPGASASIMESQVTQVLEDALAGLEGVDVMTSISREQFSQITMTFHLSRDPEGAAADVRDRVARGRGGLPDEVQDPVVQRVEADANPIIWVAFSSDRHNRLELTEFADRQVKDRLQALPGVAFVRVFGSRYTMRLWLDPERLAAHGMTPADVESALRVQNVEVPAGRIEGPMREFTVLSETDLRTEDDFNQLIIRDDGDFLVRLQDVGYAELGPDRGRFAARYKGQDSIGLGIVKQATANPLDISKAIRAEMEAIKPIVPEGMNAVLAYDSGVFIKASIDNVFKTILEATVLVALIIFFFLRTWRATLIPLVTIPVSLIGACSLMVVFGFSINTLTLLAAVLAIGMVVDDAIVVLENIHRHVENGLSPRQAAIKGGKEIGFAVIAMTLTLAAVYAPIGLQGGTTGKLFTEFAWTLAGAVIVSGFVALTLSPMMCSLLLRKNEKHGPIHDGIGRFLDRLTNSYQRAAAWSLDRKALVLIAGFSIVLPGIWAFTQLKPELAPTEDRGLFLGFFQAPEGATLDYTDGYARRLEGFYKDVPEIERFFTIVGFPVVTQGLSFVRVKDWSERERDIFEITGELRPKLFAGAPGVMAFPITPASLGQGIFSQPVQVVVRSTRPYDELADMMDVILKRVGEIPGLQNPQSDLKLNKPQLRVELNREKTSAMGVSPLEVGRALETFLGGRQVTRFKRKGDQYDVIVQLQDVDRSNPDDLNRLYVRNRDGRMVGLANVLSLTESVAPKELNHFNQLRAATLTASLSPGLAQGDALKQVTAIINEEFPDVQVDYGGNAREFIKSSAGFLFTFLLALSFIYLVLAAQFESFRDPFIILLTVPFAISGALLALWATGGSFNIYSQVGLVTLIGLIAKHGILIVEFANQRQLEGQGRHEAVIEAATTRLRPILMTTGAMVLGALPLAIATGAGAEARQQIGWAIIGGMSIGTLFTLFVIPTVYDLIAVRHRYMDPGATPDAPAAQQAG